MAERSSITQAAQIGVETTPGTAVAASKRLGSMSLELGPAIDAKTLQPTGQKYPTLQIVGKEWSEGKISGMPVYPELPYALASVINAPTVTQIMDSATPTQGYRWTFNSNSFTDDTPKTFTVEQGSAFRAHRITSVIISEYGWKWSREEISLDGKFFGQSLQDAITLTASPTLLPQVPVRASEMSFYIDTTAVALGTTKQLRTLKGEIKLSDRYAPLWVVDAAQTSFVSTVEDAPKLTFKVTQMADAQGMAQLTAMRSGGSQFFRLRNIGPNIYTGTGGTPVIVNHQCTWDVCGQIEDISPFSDEDGVYAIEWTFNAVIDPTWGKAFTVEVITTTSTL